MEDLNSVKVWEQTLRQEIEGFKEYKEKVINDPAVPKAEKRQVVDVMRTLKISMIQAIAKFI